MRLSTTWLFTILALLGGGCVDRSVLLTESVSGSLTTRLGEPLPGYTVRLSGALEAATIVGADGSFRFDAVPVGPYVLSATVDHTLEEVVTAPVNVTGGGPATAALQVTGVGSVSGMVHLIDSELWAGTRVLVGGSPAISLTDGAGAFSFSALPEGNVSLYAVRETYEPTLLGSATISRGGEATIALATLVKADRPTVALDGKAALPGKIDHSGITVTIAGTQQKTTTDASGAFHFADAPLGIIELQLASGDYTANVQSVLVSGHGPPIVLGSDPYELPTISLTLGAYLANPGTTLVFQSKDDRWLYWTEVGGAGVTSTAAIALDLQTRFVHRLEHAYVAALHTDGTQALILRYQAAPSTLTDLVAWNPDTNATTALATNVRSMQVLDKRNAVLVTVPNVTLIPLDGSAPISFGPLDLGLQVTVGTNQTTALFTTYVYPSTQKWLDLVTGKELYSSPAQTESLSLAQGGESLLVMTNSKTDYIPRQTLVRKNIVNAYPWAWSLSPGGRYLQWTGHTVDLTSLSDLGERPGGLWELDTSDDKTRLIAHANAGGLDVNALDQATGVVTPTYRIDDATAVSFGTLVKPRVAFLSIAHGTTYDIHRIDLDSGIGQKVLSGASYVGVLGGTQYHVARVIDGALHGVAIDVDSSAVTDLGYIGTPVAASPDGKRIGVRDEDRLTLVDVASHAQHPIFEWSWFSGTQPYFYWRSDGSVITARVIPSYSDYVSVAHLGEGLYLIPTMLGGGQ